MVRLLCFALLLSQVPLVAQDKPLRLAEIRTLLDLGAETTEIIAFCKQESRQWELSAADLATLEKEGADDRLLTWLRAQMPTPTPGEIDAKILIERHQAGATEAELLTLIDQAVKRSPPSLSDLLAMDGAGIPRTVSKRFRQLEAEPAAVRTVRPLTCDDLVKLAQLGVAAQEIIDRIEASDSRFPLDTGDLVDLKRKGVPLEVLRVVNQRRLTTPAEATTPTSTEVTAEELVATPGQEASPRIPQPRLVIHHDRSGYSILKPEGFADLAQFQGARSLLQLVNAAPNEGSMPEIEISVLAVLVPPNDRERLVPSSLRPFIERVTSDLRDSFRQDGLELHAEAPTETWLAARPAMRVQTVTRATDGRSYLGAHTLVFSEGRFHIVSYHVSSEQSAQWRDQLERIVDSFSLDGSALESVADTGDPRASVEALFTRWRDSLRQRDFRSWRSLHRGLADSVANRLTWLDEIQRLTGDRRRLELGRIDLEKGRLEYRRFGLDGPSSGSRDFVQDRGVWYLATLP